MKVRIYIPASTALKAGSDAHGYRVVDVPASEMTERQRATLAPLTYWGNTREPVADFYLDQKSPLDTAGHDAPSVLARLDALADHKEAEAREKHEAHEAAVQEWIDLPAEDFIYDSGTIHQLRRAVPDDPRLADKVAQARALADRINAERKEREAREKERGDRARDEAERRLRVWGESNGSELLRARIAEGFDWRSLARQEYAEQALAEILDRCPQLVEADSSPWPGLDDSEWDCDTVDRTTPSLDEIATLREVRAAIETVGIDATASLILAKYTHTQDADDVYDGSEVMESVHRTEVNIEIDTPDGWTANRQVIPRPAAD